jgi:phosphatidate cytidylyltransferase
VLPSIGLLWLRGDTLSGAATVLWLLTTVWAIDTAAYAAGKLIGGPKLAPAISPNKTWAGLCGGIAAGALVGSIAGALVSPPEIVDVALLGGVLAIVEQTGDIAESYAKRRFGAKDSGSLIPGHGGLLDRLDGMLAVTSVVVILTLAHGGSVLTWR